MPMRKKLIFALILFIMLSMLVHVRFSSIWVEASDGNPVHNINTGLDYATIQASIDASQTLDGHTINVDAGTYSEHVVVSKSISLIGQDSSSTIIDGSNVGTVVNVVANNVTVKGFTIKRGFYGIFVSHSSSCLITENYVVDHDNAIFAYYSNNCTIHENVAANNTDRGIFVTNSRNFSIADNQAYNNGMYGINANSSVNGLIARNKAYGNNHDGIGLENSNSTTIVGNDVTNNIFYGMLISQTSGDNLFYDNNILNNVGKEVSVLLSSNHWDDGVEGNFWGNYSGVDLNRDGINDMPQLVDAGLYDNYPLLGIHSNFATSLGLHVSVISNSTINDFTFIKSSTTIDMHVSNRTSRQTHGFCRVSIPYGLMVEPYNVTIDGASPEYHNYTLYDDGQNRWIYFTYSSSIREVSIQGTPPPDIEPPIISILSPENKTYTVSSVLLNFTVSEPTSWIGYSLDGEANVTISGNMTISDLSEGSHSLEIYAKDIAENTGYSEIVYFTISTEQGWPFYMLIIIAATVVVGAAIGLLVYFAKFRKNANVKQ
jgi:parallel beta-helix repeat protein